MYKFYLFLLLVQLSNIHNLYKFYLFLLLEQLSNIHNFYGRTYLPFEQVRAFKNFKSSITEVIFANHLDNFYKKNNPNLKNELYLKVKSLKILFNL